MKEGFTKVHTIANRSPKCQPVVEYKDVCLLCIADNRKVYDNIF